MSTIEIKVPDIGDFKDIPVIEVLVKAGDSVKVEDSLVTLESDKATMDVPSPVDGVVKDLKVKIGDKVSEGSLLLTVEATTSCGLALTPTLSRRREREHGARRSERCDASSSQAPAGGSREAAGGSCAALAQSARTYRVVVFRRADIECEMLVLGSGPGGYAAAFRSADLGMKTVLVERYATLGGVCLNVGCIPSKALLHTASIMDEVKAMGAHGISYGLPAIDLPKLRDFKNGVTKKLTSGLSGMAKMRKVDVVRGTGRFLDPHHLEVELTTGTGWDKTGEKKS
jgi:dihydrolipoamide dehydrogenase